MKKVVAKRWLNVDGNWYGKGETIEVKSLVGIPADAVEVISDDPEEAVAEKKPIKKAEEPKNEPKAEPRRRTTRK